MNAAPDLNTCNRSCLLSVQLRLVSPEVSIPPEVLSDIYDLFKVSSVSIPFFF